MIVLYTALENQKDHISSALLNHIPRQIKPYSRVPRAELKESIDHVLDALFDYIITNQHAQLQTVFQYIARMRHAQGIPVSAVVRALLSTTPIVRTALRRERAYCQYGEQLDDATAKVERGVFNAVALYTETFQEYLQSRVDDHNSYLSEKNQQLGIDLSKFILFRG